MAAALLGCSGAERPAPAGDSTGELESGISSSDLADPAPACVPRESRTCRLYYQDERGQWHCPASNQLCRVDGSGWTACGEYVLDPAGNIVRR
jgi:hypothetical protein